MQTEEKTVVPASPGFYAIFPVRDGDGAVVDMCFEPVVAWEILSEKGCNGNSVQPITFGGNANLLDGNVDVLCPNGSVLSENNSWASLKDWLASQK